MEDNRSENILNSEDAEQEPMYFQPPEPRVRMVLLGLLAACLLFGILGGAVFQMIALAAGWDPGVLSGALAADAPPGERWQVRLLLGISHLFTFLIAGWATLRFFYPPNRKAWNYLKADKLPDWRLLLIGTVLILVAVPLVLYTYNLNQALPIPESLRTLEEQAAESIKGLLQMDSGFELLANVVLIALLPALGEELVFRGVVQQQLMRRMGPWAAIILGAVIFSFIHFQFEGFLPRVLLGILLGWLYWQSRNIWVPVAAHFVNNAMQVVGQYMYHRDLSTIDLEQDIEVPWTAAAFSALLIFGIIHWTGKYWKNIQEQ